MNNAQAFVFGAAFGAGVTYFFDPDRGRRRRKLLRDQLVHARHEAEDRARAGLRHARNRAVGLAHEARAELVEGSVSDEVLAERVRSEVGRSVSSTGAIEVRAERGTVTLSGRVPAREIQELVRTARSVRGVEHLDNRLVVATEAGSPPDARSERGR